MNWDLAWLWRDTVWSQRKLGCDPELRRPLLPSNMRWCAFLESSLISLSLCFFLCKIGVITERYPALNHCTRNSLEGLGRGELSWGKRDACPWLVLLKLLSRDEPWTGICPGIQVVMKLRGKWVPNTYPTTTPSLPKLTYSLGVCVFVKVCSPQRGTCCQDSEDKTSESWDQRWLQGVGASLVCRDSLVNGPSNSSCLTPTSSPAPIFCKLTMWGSYPEKRWVRNWSVSLWLKEKLVNRESDAQSKGDHRCSLLHTRGLLGYIWQNLLPHPSAASTDKQHAGNGLCHNLPSITSLELFCCQISSSELHWGELWTGAHKT